MLNFFLSKPVAAAIGTTGVIGFIIATLVQILQNPAGVAVTLLPVINLVSVVAVVFAAGILYNRVTKLEKDNEQSGPVPVGIIRSMVDEHERRINKIQKVVFNEDNPWTGRERRNRPARSSDE